MGRKKNPDTFDKWVRDGVWPKVRDLIKKLKQNGFTNKYICERLGITEATFIGLYNNHAEIREVFYEFLESAVPEAMSELKKHAFGYYVEEEDKEISSKNESKGQKGGKHKRWIPGNYRALVHYMTIMFGPEYMENYYALEYMKKAKEDAKENWLDGNQNRV